MYETYVKEKAMLLLIAVLIVSLSAVGGFFAGQYYAITQTKTEVCNGMVLMELDGQTYVHVLGG